MTFSVDHWSCDQGLTSFQTLRRLKVECRCWWAGIAQTIKRSKDESNHSQTLDQPTFWVSLALTAMTRVLAGISMCRTVFHPPGRKFVLTPSTWSSRSSSSAVMESLLVSEKQRMTTWRVFGALIKRRLRTFAGLCALSSSLGFSLFGHSVVVILKWTRATLLCVLAMFVVTSETLMKILTSEHATEADTELVAKEQLQSQHFE